MHTIYETRLGCVHCGEDTAHQVEYVGGLLVRSRCAPCGREIRKPPVWLKQTYLVELRQRVSSKPWRLAGELRASLPLFLLRAPKRAVTKPFRMLEEVVEVELRLPKAS